jgi:hypothetical protein
MVTCADFTLSSSARFSNVFKNTTFIRFLLIEI